MRSGLACGGWTGTAGKTVSENAQGMLFVPTPHGLRPAAAMGTLPGTLPETLPEALPSSPIRSTAEVPASVTAPNDASKFSDEAYRRIKKDLGPQRRKVLAFIEQRGSRGSTADEFARAHNLGINRISGRFSELAATGLIVKSRVHVSRLTRTGHAAAVWVAAAIIEHIEEHRHERVELGQSAV